MWCSGKQNTMERCLANMPLHSVRLNTRSSGSVRVGHLCMAPIYLRPCQLGLCFSQTFSKTNGAGWLWWIFVRPMNLFGQGPQPSTLLAAESSAASCISLPFRLVGGCAWMLVAAFEWQWAGAAPCPMSPITVGTVFLFLLCFGGLENTNFTLLTIKE